MSVTTQYTFTPTDGLRNARWLFTELRGVSFDILTAVFPRLGEEILVPHADVPLGHVAVVLGMVITASSGGTVTQTTGEWRGTRVSAAPVHTPVISMGVARDGGPTMYSPALGDLPLYNGDPGDLGTSRGLGIQGVPLSASGIIRILGFAKMGFGKPIGSFA